MTKDELDKDIDILKASIEGLLPYYIDAANDIKQTKDNVQKHKDNINIIKLIKIKCIIKFNEHKLYKIFKHIVRKYNLLISIQENYDKFI